MAHRSVGTLAPGTPEVSPPNAAALVLIGLLAALALPFLVFSTASSDALRESKLLVQALGASLALLGLALGGVFPGFGRGRAARAAVLGLLAAVVLALLSAFANADVVDPLTAAAVLSPLALLLAGSSTAGARVAPVAATVLMAAGAFTGSLAALQRWAGLFRLPLDAPEPRFLAAGLIGNAGDVGMALVVPALLLFTTAAEPGTNAWRRCLAALGLVPTLLGLLATESVGPALAFGAGAIVFVALDVRQRRLALCAIALAVLLAGVTGAGRRALVKLGQLRKGDVAAASTQRDIGLLAAREMLRARPLLGAGPGAFSNRFVPARLAAEERTGWRLWHRSGSAHFDNAHSEPVTLAAEAGLPAACAATMAALALFAGLLARRREEKTPPLDTPTTDTLFAALCAVALLALGDFPLRIPVASGPAAFLAGVALRRIAGGGAERLSLFRGSRVLLATLGLLVAVLAAGRSLATLAQAEGEDLLRDAASAPEEAAAERAELLSAAGVRLERAIAFRPRSATALLALGSVYALRGERDLAYALYARSVRLEERAESDLNLGRAALSLGRTDEAIALFRRSVWILPRLLEALPPEVDREQLAIEIDAAAQALSHGGHAPGLPPDGTVRAR
jgi:O-antigen ligase